MIFSLALHELNKRLDIYILIIVLGCKRFIGVQLKGLGRAILGNFVQLILSIMSSKRQIGRARVFHLQNQGHITTENDFPAV